MEAVALSRGSDLNSCLPSGREEEAACGQERQRMQRPRGRHPHRPRTQGESVGCPGVRERSLPRSLECHLQACCVCAWVPSREMTGAAEEGEAAGAGAGERGGPRGGGRGGSRDLAGRIDWMWRVRESG